MSNIFIDRPVDWLLGAGIVVFVTTATIPILASAKNSNSPDVSDLRRSSMAAALYAQDFEVSTPYANCVQEGHFVSSDGGCKDLQTGVVWGTSWWLANGGPGVSFPNFFEATSYCSNLTEGGYSDWRLPSGAELLDASSNSAGYYVKMMTDPPRSGTHLLFSSTTRRGEKEVLGVDLLTGSNAWMLVKAGGKGGGYTRVDLHCVRNSN